MKKYFLFLLFIAFIFTSCSTTPKNTDTLYEWGEYSIPPSRITTSGDIIMRTAPYSDGAKCIVYYDPELASDSSYYYIMLMQDFGWSRNTSGNWSGNGYAIKPKEGTIYVNPAQRVAVYFYPNGNWGVLRVRIIRD